MQRRNSNLPLFATLLVTVLLGLPVFAQDKVAIEAAKIIVDGTGEIIDGVLLIEAGKVREVGTRATLSIPADYRRVDRRRYTVAPGWIDVASLAGAPNDLSEAEDAVDSVSRAADSFNPSHRDFALLAAAGVTAVCISPGDDNVVSGIGCVVKTAGAAPRTVLADGPMKLSLGREVASPERHPMSFMGARALLRETLERARLEVASTGALETFARGGRPGLMTVRQPREILAALELRRDFKLDLSLLDVDAIRGVSSDLKGTGLKCAIAAFDLQTAKPRLLLAKELEDGGVSVAFHAESPRRAPAVLRLSAALAHRSGLSRKGALESITTIPAAMAGATDRIGQLTAGRDADFVVLDGDVLDISAQLVETWIGGQRVAATARQEER